MKFWKYIKYKLANSEDKNNSGQEKIENFETEQSIEKQVNQNMDLQSNDAKEQSENKKTDGINNQLLQDLKQLSTDIDNQQPQSNSNFNTENMQDSNSSLLEQNKDSSLNFSDENNDNNINTDEKIIQLIMIIVQMI